MKKLIDRCYEQGKNIQHDKSYSFRMNVLKEFLGEEKNSVSVGCGAFEPVFLNIPYCCDIAPEAETYLAKQGYQGKFIYGDVRDIPYSNKKFKIAVCSEVIEHLNAEGDVVLAFHELNRISESWLITTPCVKVPEPTHNFVFTEEQLKRLAAPLKIAIIKKDICFFISNDERKLNSIVSLQP